jgi:hypothetical protein
MVAPTSPICLGGININALLEVKTDMIRNEVTRRFAFCTLHFALKKAAQKRTAQHTHNTTK